MDPITPTTSSLTSLTAASTASTGRVSTPPTPGSSTSSGTPAPTDQVQISLKGTLAAKYVQEVRAVAPLDQEAVRQLKAAIAKGNYPPPALIQGLISLVGATFPSINPAANEQAEEQATEQPSS